MGCLISSLATFKKCLLDEMKCIHSLARAVNQCSSTESTRVKEMQTREHLTWDLFDQMESQEIHYYPTVLMKAF